MEDQYYIIRENYGQPKKVEYLTKAGRFSGSKSGAWLLRHEIAMRTVLNLIESQGADYNFMIMWKK